MRTVPVEFAALFTPEKGKTVLFPWGIIRTVNLREVRFPQDRVAERTAASSATGGQSIHDR